MKKLKVLSLSLGILAVTAAFVACNSSTLSTIFSGGTIANAFTSVIGLDKVTRQGLIGTWNYNGPGIAFTSKDLLAKAGGEVAATKIEQELLPYYNKVGISASNTYAIFDANGNYSVSVDGKKFSGKYTFDEENAKLTLQGWLFNVNCYAKREDGGISLLFEASKLLTLMQTMSAASGNSSSTLGTISDVAKNYNGLRVGFDMK